MTRASGRIKKRLKAKGGEPEERERPKRVLKPGLLHSLQAVEVQTVSGRMKLPCRECGDVPVGRRLAVKKGSGRTAKTHAYCIKCGRLWLRMRAMEFERAEGFLCHGEVSDTLARVSGIENAADLEANHIRLPSTVRIHLG